MKSAKSLCIALFAFSLLAADSGTAHAQTTQQTVDQAKGDSSTAKKSGKKNADSATPKKNSSKSSTTSTAAAAPVSKPAAVPSGAPGNAAPASKPTAAHQQTPPATPSGMVWVNTDSGVYHKPGTRWYGKTKQGKYMTEADAQKAGYRAAATAAPKKKSN
jgi:hypothetical protein